MTAFILNLFLALAWIIITEDFSVSNFLAGFGLSFLTLKFTRGFGETGITYFREDGVVNPLTKLWQTFSFLCFFFYELILANLRVAYEVLAPPSKQTMSPGIVAVPLDIKSDDEISLMANFITLTPGTLSVDVSEDRTILYVHAMHISDRTAYIQELKDELEQRVMEVCK